MYRQHCSGNSCVPTLIVLYSYAHAWGKQQIRELHLLLNVQSWHDVPSLPVLQATLAYLGGNKALAKELSSRGHEAARHMWAAHAAAAETILEQRNAPMQRDRAQAYRRAGGLQCGTGGLQCGAGGLQWPHIHTHTQWASHWCFRRCWRRPSEWGSVEPCLVVSN